MFCKKCGTQIGDDIKFCPKCGTAVAQEKAPASAVESVKGNLLKHKASYAVILIVVVALFLVLRSCTGGNNYESPIKTMIAAVEKRDTSKLLDIIPDEVIDAYEEQSGVDIKKMAESVGDRLFSSLGKDGASMSFDYKINKETDLTLTEIESLKSKIERKMNVTLDISEAKELDVTLIKDENGEKDYDDETLTVIKVGKKWYMSPLGFS